MLFCFGRFPPLFGGETEANIIKKVKDTVSIPVIGNGDILTGEDAIRMFKETGCDAVIFAGESGDYSPAGATGSADSSEAWV